MAGPGRRIDATAMIQAVKARSTRWRLHPCSARPRSCSLAASWLSSWRTWSSEGDRHSRCRVDPAASASPSPPATVLPGLVTEEVEPGVLRIIRDDAGHDLDERFPDWRYDLDDMTITPDGTVWLTSTYHDSDNGVGEPQAPLVWALGRPGVLGVADGIPPSVRSLVPLLDGSVLAIGGEDVRVDGTSVIPDDGPAVRPVHGGELWLVRSELLPRLSGGDMPDGRLAMIGTPGAGSPWTRWAARPAHRPTDAR